MLGPGDGMAIQPTVRLVSLVSLVQTRPSTATSWSPTTTLYPSIAHCALYPSLSRCEAAVSDHISSKLGVVNLPPREARHYQHYHPRYTDTECHVDTVLLLHSVVLWFPNLSRSADLNKIIKSKFQSLPTLNLNPNFFA